MATSGAQGQTVDTELPAAVAAYLLGFQGTSWNRVGVAFASGDASNGGYLLGSANWVYNGALYDRARTPSRFVPLNAVNVGAGETTLWTPAAGKKFRLMGYVLTVTAAGVLTLRDNTAGTTIGLLGLAAAAPLPSPPMGNGQLSAAANNVLTGQLSVAGTVTGVLFGTEE